MPLEMLRGMGPARRRQQIEGQPADYIAVHDACPLRAPAYSLKNARLETPTQAVITVGFLGMAQAYKVNYETRQWQRQTSRAARRAPRRSRR
jgi:hypothetical protein